MVRFANFADMEPDEHGVVHALVRKAREPQEHAFLPLIYLWMAFNGWMTAVTGRVKDNKMIADIASNTRMQAAYADLMATSEVFRDHVNDFVDLWPIFDTRAARKFFGPSQFRRMSREEVLAAGSADVRVDPEGWQPGDRPTWPQLMWVLYRVRCNLFHGQKSPALGRDRDLVVNAGRVLQTFVDGAEILRWTTEDE
jgi:hypothetical protein